MAQPQQTEQRVISANEKDRLEKEITRLEEKRIELTSRLGETGGDYRENAAFQDLDAEIQNVIRTIKLHQGTLANSIVGTDEHDQHPYLNQRLIMTIPPSSEEITYEIVPMDKVDPALGKISPSSPFSVAVADKKPGDTFEVTLASSKGKTPPKTRYKFERVEAD